MGRWNDLVEKILHPTKPKARVAESVLKHIALEKIFPNPYQPRRYFDEQGLAELAQSIRTYGVLVPIIVREIEQGYELVCGERRVRACRLAGLEKVPAIINWHSFDKIIEITFLENLQRRDLNVVEEAETYYRLSTEFANISRAELAQKLGKSEQEIAEHIWILDLPVIIRKALAAGLIDKGHAKLLARLKDQKHYLRALEEIYKNALSLEETEEFIEELIIKEDGTADLAQPVQLTIEIDNFPAGDLPKPRRQGLSSLEMITES